MLRRHLGNVAAVAAPFLGKASLLQSHSFENAKGAVWKQPQAIAMRHCSTVSPARIEALEEQLAALKSQLSNGAAENGASPSAVDKASASSSKEPVPLHILSSVVKIYTSMSAPNSLIPWQRKLQNHVTGTGFVVDRKRRLLCTNAHVVSFTTFVEVRKHGDSHKYTGYIVYIAQDCDLALVHVEDENFWADEQMQALEFEGGAQGAGAADAAAGSGGEGASSSSLVGVDELLNIDRFSGLPALQEDVKVVGYPLGGDQISITSGVVSRIDVTSYGGIGTNLLTIQLDAAINSGNSGGPALCNKKVIGIAFQSLINADSIGYIIPNPVISVFFRAFIKSKSEALLQKSLMLGIPAPTPAPAPAGVEDASSPSGEQQPQQPPSPPPSNPVIGHRSYHSGFCSLGIVYQDMSNKTLRESVNLPEGMTGIMVRDIYPMGAASRSDLKIDDVIVKVDGTDIANDATIEWRPRERLRFSHLVRTKLVGEPLALTVWRNKAGLQEVTVVSGIEQMLVPNHTFTEEYREQPKFRIFGGFVFSTVTMGLLLEWGANEWYNNAPRWLTELVHCGVVTEKRQEVVCIVQKLPHDVNKGYNNFNNKIVTHFGGVEIKSLEHMQTLLDAAIESGKEDPSAIVKFQTTTGNINDYLVLPLHDCLTADAQLQAAYRIPSLRNETLPTEQDLI